LLTAKAKTKLHICTVSFHRQEGHVRLSKPFKIFAFRTLNHQYKLTDTYLKTNTISHGSVFTQC